MEQNAFTLQQALDKIQTLKNNIATVIKGKSEQIDLILTTLLSSGHILLEDNPGTGKTMMAKALAQSISSQQENSAFKRVQFTPDLLPMDLLGTHIFDEAKKDFIFKKGPLFCNILLADEINRASPRVQSALLECMAENQITIGEKTYPLEKLFFAIATENPIEMEGTYPLPAAQLDRFSIKISFGYVDELTEKNIYAEYGNIAQQANDIQAVVSIDDIIQLKKTAENVAIHEEIINAVTHIVRQTREHTQIALGASVRAGIALLKCLKAYALIHGRDYVIESDLEQIVAPVLHHRLSFKSKEGESEALAEILSLEMNRLSKLHLTK